MSPRDAWEGIKLWLALVVIVIGSLAVLLVMGGIIHLVGGLY